MKYSHRLVRVLILAAVLAFVGASCKTGQTPALDETAIRAYADPATETLLQGLSNGNLAQYVEYGDQQFKDAVTPDIFDPLVAQMKEQLGTYESIEFVSVGQSQGYIVVHYRAMFSKGEVGVRMVFDQDHLIAGQFFE